MNEHNTTAAAAAPAVPAAPAISRSRFSRGRRLLGVAAIALVGFGAGLVASHTSDGIAFAADGPMGGEMMEHHGRMHDPAKMAEMATKHLHHMLAKVNATDDQQQRAAAILQQSLTEQQASMEQHKGQHEKIMALLAAPQIDKAAIEQMRAEHVQAFDAMSKRHTQMLVSIAEVLTPEQRAKLAEIMKKEGPGHFGHHE